jgi:hypothetical protein
MTEVKKISSSKKRKELLNSIIEKNKKCIVYYEEKNQKYKAVLKSVDFDVVDKHVEEFTGEFIDVDDLRGLYLTNNYDVIFKDIKLQHPKRSEHGKFFNKNGKCAELLLQDSCGVSWCFNRDKKTRECVDDFTFTKVFQDFDAEDYHQEIVDLQLQDCILSIVNEGYFYLMKKKPDGTEQYQLLK